MSEAVRMKRGALVLLLLSCTSIQNLKQPAWVRSRLRGVCGSTLALDADQQVWAERGCENGDIVLKLQHRASDANAKRVREAFDALGADACASPPYQSPRHGTAYRVLARDGGTWVSCETDGGDPYATVEAAFESL